MEPFQVGTVTKPLHVVLPCRVYGESITPASITPAHMFPHVSQPQERVSYCILVVPSHPLRCSCFQGLAGVSIQPPTRQTGSENRPGMRDPLCCNCFLSPASPNGVEVMSSPDSGPAAYMGPQAGGSARKRAFLRCDQKGLEVWRWHTTYKGYT